MAPGPVRQLQLPFADLLAPRAVSGALISPGPVPAALDSMLAPENLSHAETSDASRALALADQLSSLLGHPVRLAVHDNRSTMVSFKRTGDRWQLRLHHMFLRAPPAVVKALGRYLIDREARASALLDAFVRENRSAISRPAVRRPRLQHPQGAVHDLSRLFDELNARYFSGNIKASIGWGRGGAADGRRRRTIRMGAYFSESQSILIHPALDRPAVPDYFVAFVVYHEMLHQAVPHTEGPSGRRCVHSREFRRRERLFHDFERARAWERRHIGVLLRPSDM